MTDTVHAQHDQALICACFMAGYLLGCEHGTDIGRQLETDERDDAWNAIARPASRSGPSHAELELRRWGPAGREHAGDSRPGDYQGLGGEAA